MYCISNFHWAFLLLFIYMVRINQVSKLIFDPSKEKNIRMKGIDCSENITQKCICAVSTIIDLITSQFAKCWQIFLDLNSKRKYLKIKKKIIVTCSCIPKK